MRDSVPSVPTSESLNSPSTLAEDVDALKFEPSDIVSTSHSESPREDALYFTHDENSEPTSDLSSFIEGLDERNGLYDAIPPNLYIKKTEYAGRGVFASKPIRAGTYNLWVILFLLEAQRHHCQVARCLERLWLHLCSRHRISSRSAHHVLYLQPQNAH
jgi:hypothetical protein